MESFNSYGLDSFIAFDRNLNVWQTLSESVYYFMGLEMNKWLIEDKTSSVFSVVRTSSYRVYSYTYFSAQLTYFLYARDCQVPVKKNFQCDEEFSMYKVLFCSCKFWLCTKKGLNSTTLKLKILFQITCFQKYASCQ